MQQQLYLRKQIGREAAVLTMPAVAVAARNATY